MHKTNMAKITHKGAVSHIAQSDTTVTQKIVQQLSVIDTFNQALQTCLELRLAEHCRVANYDKGRLVIEADSAACATAIRYRIPELLAALRQNLELPALTQIDYYVKPEQATPQVTTTKNHLQISAASAETLHGMAEGIKDEKLRNLLQRIAKHRAE